MHTTVTLSSHTLQPLPQLHVHITDSCITHLQRCKFCSSIKVLLFCSTLVHSTCSIHFISRILSASRILFFELDCAHVTSRPSSLSASSPLLSEMICCLRCLRVAPGRTGVFCAVFESNRLLSLARKKLSPVPRLSTDSPSSLSCPSESESPGRFSPLPTESDPFTALPGNSSSESLKSEISLAQSAIYVKQAASKIT